MEEILHITYVEYFYFIFSNFNGRKILFVLVRLRWIVLISEFDEKFRIKKSDLLRVNRIKKNLLYKIIYYIKITTLNITLF